MEIEWGHNGSSEARRKAGVKKKQLKENEISEPI